jgi:molecular chaperone GrpE
MNEEKTTPINNQGPVEAEVVEDEEMEAKNAEEARRTDSDPAAEALKYKELFVRTQAEMENMKKRLEREKADYYRFANEAIIKDLLPVLDNLERALAHAEVNDDQTASFVEGVRLTHEGLKNVLEKYGVVLIEAQGRKFDPNFHEAVMQREDAEAEPGTVLQEVQKGYLLNGRLLRPTMAVVSRRPA